MSCHPILSMDHASDSILAERSQLQWGPFPWSGRLTPPARGDDVYTDNCWSFALAIVETSYQIVGKPRWAQRRLAEYDPNAPTAENREPWYVLFLKQSANPLIYMPIGAALVKAYLKGLVDAAMIW